jgi:hypothetical protein
VGDVADRVDRIDHPSREERSMTKRLLSVCALGLLLFARGAASADAQTVAAGPYYALPSWDQKLACSAPANCPRFVVLSNWDSQAVLDRETGIVWERAPNVFPFENPQSLSNAHFGCTQKDVSNRKGWRLATVEELQSLVDVTNPTIALPPGHPFIGVKSSFATYWAATRVPNMADLGYVIGFAPGGVFGTNSLSASNFYWCVRGPGGAIS